MRPMGGPVPGLNPSGASNHRDSATLSAEQQAKSKVLASKQPLIAGLSDEQTAMVNHVLKSTDKVILVIGDAVPEKPARSCRL